jgi:calcineurin-like phosphoesterase family protein
MSDVFFVGDLHIGHNNIVKYRPVFDDIEDHNSTLYANMKSVGGKRCTLFLMGDILFNKRSIPFVQDMVSHFGKLIYIPGNHDLERDMRMQDLIDAFGCEIQAMRKYKEFWLTHCPIHPAELRGRINIHGHVHGATIMDQGGQEDKRYFNASVENIDYTPISLDEVRAKRQGVREQIKAKRRE